MCKIFAMTNMEKVILSQKFVEAVKQQVCKLGDKDGFGYAVLGTEGELGGERTIRPHSFKPLAVDASTKVVFKLPIVLKSSNVFGRIATRNPKAFIAHGRLSTNEITIQNTHPFTNGEVALIHNGIVDDEFDMVKKSLVTTCDSEILLRHWELGGMKSIEEGVSGYYALAVLDKKGKLHIARDDRAMLYISYVRTVHSYMIATTKEIIQGVCRKMKWKYEQPEEMLPDMYAVFDGNEILSHEAIEPMGMGYQINTTKANAALGYYNEGWDGKEYVDYGSRHYLGHGVREIESMTKPDQETMVATVTELHRETDPTEEPVPGYKEAMDRDEYYEGRHSEEMTNGFAGTANFRDRAHSDSFMPPELRGLQSDDDGPSESEIDGDASEGIQDVVAFMEENDRADYAG